MINKNTPATIPAPQLFPSLTGIDIALLLLAVGLIYVFPIPGVISLRTLFGASIVVILLILYREKIPFAAWRNLWRHCPLAWRLYLVLTLWVVLQASVFAIRPSYTFNEVRGLWFGAVLFSLAGYGLALHFRSHTLRYHPLIIAVFAGLAFLILFHNFLVFHLWGALGEFPWQDSPLAYTRREMSVTVNTFIVFIVADFLSRQLLAKRLLPVSTAFLSLFFVLALFTVYQLVTRNGVISATSLLLSTAFLFAYNKRAQLPLKKLVIYAIVFISGIAAFVVLNYEKDSRWQTLKATIPIALDTTNNLAWTNKSIPPPLLPNGTPVVESNYERIAWAKEGALAILDFPLGVGFGRQAFAIAMQHKYPSYASVENSHIGLVDIAIALGIPGLLLWIGLQLSLALTGWRSYSRKGQPAGLLLLFIVGGFFGRSIVDSNTVGALAMQSFFISFLLLGILHPLPKHTLKN